MEESEINSVKLGVCFILGVSCVLLLTMGIVLGEAAAAHNNALAELVFSDMELPDSAPESVKEDILWMREKLKALEMLSEEKREADAEMPTKPDLLRMQAYFYVLFFGDGSDRVSLEAFYACFIAEDVSEMEENLAQLLGRPILEAETANAAELYYRLQYGFSMSGFEGAFEDWLSRLPESSPGGALPKKDGSVSPISMDWRKVVSSEFGVRRDPLTGERKGHRGIDLAVPTGTKVYCAWDGRVQTVRYSKSGYGYHVMIDHGNGLITIYAHCSKLVVREGQKVKAGDVLALSGNTGKSTGPHLHFEVRLNGEAQNPRNYLP